MFSPVLFNAASQTAISARSSPAWSSVSPNPAGIPSRAQVDVAVQTESVPDEALAQPPFVSDAARWRPAENSDIPNELWGEVASFSLREDILNLRSVSAAMRVQADTAISEVTLRGSQALIDFAYTDSFRHLQTVHLRQMDRVALNLFANRLTTHPRENLEIDLADSHVGVADALGGYSALPLGALLLDNPYVTPEVVDLLSDCAFPITLTGYMTREELFSASRIPTLTSLSVKSSQFSDDVAFVFKAHPAMQKLSFSLNQSFSSAGLLHLAAMPNLRELQLSDSVFMSNAISTMAARQLAAQATLERLSIQTRRGPLSEACFSALSGSVSLKSLAISVGPGMHHVTGMVSLERLELNAGIGGNRPMDVRTAQLIGEMPSLKSLHLNMVTFQQNAFRTLISHLHAETLHLVNIAVDEAGVTALLSNTLLKTLSLAGVRIAPEHVVALCQHASLRRLTIDGVQCELAAH